MLPSDINELLLQDHDSLISFYPDLLDESLLIQWLLTLSVNHVEEILTHLSQQHIFLNFPAIALVNRKWREIPIIKTHINQLASPSNTNNDPEKIEIENNQDWRILSYEQRTLNRILDTYEQLQRKRIFRWILGKSRQDLSEIQNIRTAIYDPSVSSKTLHAQLKKLRLFDGKHRFRAWLCRLFFKSAKAVTKGVENHQKYTDFLESTYVDCENSSKLKSIFSSKRFRMHCKNHHITSIKSHVAPNDFARMIVSYWPEHEYKRIWLDNIPDYDSLVTDYQNELRIQCPTILQKEYKLFLEQKKADDIQSYDQFLLQFITQPHIQNILAPCEELLYTDIVIIFKATNLNSYLKHAFSKIEGDLNAFINENIAKILSQHNELTFDIFFEALTNHNETLGRIAKWLNQHEHELTKLKLKTIRQLILEHVTSLFDHTVSQFRSTIIEMPLDESFKLVELNDNGEFEPNIRELKVIPSCASGCAGIDFEKDILGQSLLNQYQERIAHIIKTSMIHVAAKALAFFLKNQSTDDMINAIHNQAVDLNHPEYHFYLKKLFNQDIDDEALSYDKSNHQIRWSPLSLSLMITCIKVAGNTPLTKILAQSIKAISTRHVLSIDYKTSMDLLSAIKKRWPTHLLLIQDDTRDGLVARRLMRTQHLGALSEFSHLFNAMRILPEGEKKANMFAQLLNRASSEMNKTTYGTLLEFQEKIEQYQDLVDINTGALPDKQLEDVTMYDWLVRGFWMIKKKNNDDHQTLISRLKTLKQAFGETQPFIDQFDLKVLQEYVIAQRLSAWNKVKSKPANGAIIPTVDKKSRLTYELLFNIVEDLEAEFGTHEWVILIKKMVSRFEHDITQASFKHWPDDIITKSDARLLRIINKISLSTKLPEKLKKTIAILDDNIVLSAKVILKTSPDTLYSIKELNTKLDEIKSACKNASITEIVLAMQWLISDGSKASIMTKISKHLTSSGNNILYIGSDSRHAFHLENYKNRNGTKINQDELYNAIINFVRSYVYIFELSCQKDKLTVFINKNSASNTCLEACTASLFEWATGDLFQDKVQTCAEFINEHRQDLDNLAEFYEDDTPEMQADRIAQWLHTLNHQQSLSHNGRFFKPTPKDFKEQWQSLHLKTC